MSAADIIRKHWPLYLIEAGGLGVFMLAAGLACSALEAPASPLHVMLTSALLRRFLMGLAMGGTAVALIYSPWGARSGAHFNPALTLSFAMMGKISRIDAVGYVVAQFLGGLCGVLLTLALVGAPFARPPVSFVVTTPGQYGTAIAFMLEVLISAMLMGVSLYASNKASLMKYTGLLCGMLIVLFVTFESPYSGMSMNPARTVASAIPSGIWTAGWLYFIAPPGGMFIAAWIYCRFHPRHVIACAKLNHDTETPCHFECCFAAQRIHVPSLMRRARSCNLLRDTL
ncbi:MIP/aquaporin family protein [Undibacterium sp. TJN19]|uniref:MIP/aquaporin family protein n=1 Tax=Undibacterium sp. TJN19 TaxID=3413055 RepID=UPI003BF1A0DD